MKFNFDKWLGKNALSRIENLRAEKLDEIAKAEQAQTTDLIGIQKQIDRIDTEIFGLKKKRKNFETAMESAKAINQSRLAQLRAELSELEANAQALAQPGVLSLAAGKSVTIKTGESQ